MGSESLQRGHRRGTRAWHPARHPGRCVSVPHQREKRHRSRQPLPRTPRCCLRRPLGVSAPCWGGARKRCPRTSIPMTRVSTGIGIKTFYRRPRRKRDLASCRVCNLGRVFDESGFHLSPQLKHVLIASGQLPETHRESDYPEEQLVRTCVENRLDLPSIRHTLRELDLPVEMSEQIESLKLAALPALDQSCWDAFQKLDTPAGPSDIYLAGPFIGIGWGPPAHDPGQKISGRWLGGGQAASILSASRLALTVRFMSRSRIPPSWSTGYRSRCAPVPSSRGFPATRRTHLARRFCPG